MASSESSFANSEFAVELQQELRRIATNLMKKEGRPGHTLQPTALVNEAMIRLQGVTAQSKAGFRSLAIKNMERALIDHQRIRDAAKRGGKDKNAARALIACKNEYTPVESTGEDLSSLKAAIDKLRAERPEAADCILLKYFSDWKPTEIAEAHGVPVEKVNQHLTFAKAFLRTELTERSSSEE